MSLFRELFFQPIIERPWRNQLSYPTRSVHAVKILVMQALVLCWGDVFPRAVQTANHYLIRASLSHLIKTGNGNLDMKEFIAHAQQHPFRSWCVPNSMGEQGRLEQRGSVEELQYLCDGVFL